MPISSVPVASALHRIAAAIAPSLVRARIVRRADDPGAAVAERVRYRRAVSLPNPTDPIGRTRPGNPPNGDAPRPTGALRVLMIGDLIGKPGRVAVEQLLPGLREERGIDFATANGENVAGGMGLTPSTAQSLLAAGVDVITSGNHIWDKREIYPFLESSD